MAIVGVKGLNIWNKWCQ